MIRDRRAADPVDYTQLYREHWRPLLRLAQSLVDDAASAEDIVQDAFTGLYRRERHLDGPDGAAGYLRTGVLNGARSALRRRRTFRARSVALYDDRPAPSADEPMLLTAEHDAVRTGHASRVHGRTIMTTQDERIRQLLVESIDAELGSRIDRSGSGSRSAP